MTERVGEAGMIEKEDERRTGIKKERGIEKRDVERGKKKGLPRGGRRGKRRKPENNRLSLNSRKKRELDFFSRKVDMLGVMTRQVEKIAICHHRSIVSRVWARLVFKPSRCNSDATVVLFAAQFHCIFSKDAGR